MIPLNDHNPTRRFPLLTVALIVTCVLVYLWQFSLPEAQSLRAVYALGVVPAVLFDLRQLPPDIVLAPASVTVITSMFLHGGWLHLLGNMLYLWIFGNNVEDVLGRPLYLLFYTASGIAAVFAHAVPDMQSTIPMIGASGAISGVLGAYLLLFPRARILVVIPLGLYLYSTRLPALVVLGFWFVMQLVYGLLSSSEGGGVAWGAHIGGFIAGMILIVLMRPRRVLSFTTR